MSCASTHVDWKRPPTKCATTHTPLSPSHVHALVLALSHARIHAPCVPWAHVPTPSSSGCSGRVRSGTLLIRRQGGTLLAGCRMVHQHGMAWHGIGPPPPPPRYSGSSLLVLPPPSLHWLFPCCYPSPVVRTSLSRSCFPACHRHCQPYLTLPAIPNLPYTLPNHPTSLTSNLAQSIVAFLLHRPASLPLALPIRFTSNS